MAEPTDLTVVPESPRATALSVRAVQDQINLIQEIMKQAMKDGEHYGVIPGCGDKPALLKPGAEKLCLTFRMAPEYDISETNLPNGHREIRIICKLKHINSGHFLGEGIGSCSTMESKYRYRSGEGEDTGQDVPKAYWDLRKVDAKKAQEMIGGAGFGTRKIDGLWKIVKRGEKVENPDISDVFNTVLKMAKKRALVDAVLTVTAASDIFTQDIEDLPQETAANQGTQKPTNVVDAPVVSQVTQAQESLSDKQRAFFWAQMKTFGLGEDVVRAIVRHVRGQESTAGMTKEQMDLILEKARGFSEANATARNAAGMP